MSEVHFRAGSGRFSGATVWFVERPPRSPLPLNDARRRCKEMFRIYATRPGRGALLDFGLSCKGIFVRKRRGNTDEWNEIPTNCAFHGGEHCSARAASLSNAAMNGRKIGPESESLSCGQYTQVQRGCNKTKDYGSE